MADDYIVTERDFRRPEFLYADPKDYERRDDGAIVRKDRWENGIRQIRSLLGDPRPAFEVGDVVSAVAAIVASIDPQPDEREDADV